MTLIITDIESRNLSAKDPEHIYIEKSEKILPCRGCFGCWVKTPGQCVLKDGYEEIGKKISECSSIIVVSKLTYGSYSPFVKNVLDRSISYVHPYFRIDKNKMRHRKRYNNKLSISAYFYSDPTSDNFSPSDDEKNTAKELVSAQSVNLGATVENITFLDAPIYFRSITLY